MRSRSRCPRAEMVSPAARSGASWVHDPIAGVTNLCRFGLRMYRFSQGSPAGSAASQSSVERILAIRASASAWSCSQNLYAVDVALHVFVTPRRRHLRVHQTITEATMTSFLRVAPTSRPPAAAPRLFSLSLPGWASTWPVGPAQSSSMPRRAARRLRGGARRASIGR
jgi:hypothetical protein